MQVTVEALRLAAEPMSVADIEKAICDILKLPEAERNRRHRRDRRTEVGYRAAWARTLLRKEGAIERTGFGKWRLVKAGPISQRDDGQNQ
jgi:restriction endonuclease Mrr